MAESTDSGKGGHDPTFLERVGSAAANFGRRAPKRRWVRFALGSLLTILVFGFLVATVVSQWSEIENAGIAFEVVWLLPAIIVMGVYFVLAGAAWGLILARMGNPIEAGQAQRTYAQPMLVRYVPGTVLFVLAKVLLTERAGVSRRVATAAIVYELAISASAALSIAAWFLIVHPDLATYWTRWLPLLIVPLLMALLQIRYGLSPLRRVRAAIQNLRATGAGRITEPLPLEVQLSVGQRSRHQSLTELSVWWPHQRWQTLSQSCQ